MKIFSKLFLVTVLTAVFCACSSDDGDDLPKEPKPVAVNISYSYENTAEFLKYVDVNITYLDKDGKEQNVVLNNNSWKYEATVNYASAPKNYACKITLKKTGTEPESETCEAKGFGAYALSVSSVYDDGETYPFGPSVKHTVKADKFSIVEALKTIPAEGKVVYEYTFTNKK